MVGRVEKEFSSFVTVIVKFVVHLHATPRQCSTR